MTDLKTLLTGGDPVRKEGELSPADASRMRRLIVAATLEPSVARTPWQRPFAIAAIGALVVVGAIAGHRRIVEPAPLTQRPSRSRRLAAARWPMSAVSYSLQRPAARASSGSSIKIFAFRSRCRDASGLRSTAGHAFVDSGAALRRSLGSDAAGKWSRPVHPAPRRRPRRRHQTPACSGAS